MILSRKKVRKLRSIFWEEKENLLRMEKKALKNLPRLNFYHYILTSTPKKFNITQKTDFTPKKVLFKRNTEDIISEGGWLLK